MLHALGRTKYKKKEMYFFESRRIVGMNMEGPCEPEVQWRGCTFDRNAYHWSPIFLLLYFFIHVMYECKLYREGNTHNDKRKMTFIQFARLRVALRGHLFCWSQFILYVVPCGSGFMLIRNIVGAKHGKGKARKAEPRDTHMRSKEGAFTKSLQIIWMYNLTLFEHHRFGSTSFLYVRNFHVRAIFYLRGNPPYAFIYSFYASIQ